MKVFGGNNHKNKQDTERRPYREKEEDLVLNPSAAGNSKNKNYEYKEQSYSDKSDSVKYSAAKAYGDEDSADTITAASRSRKKRRRKKGLTVFIVILAILALLVAAYSIWSRPPEIDDSGLVANNETPEPSSDAASPDPDESDDGVEPTTGRKDYCYTFLIVGTDQVSGSTDTMILGMMDTKNHTLNFIHIPRDTMVNVSWSVKRVNTYMSATDGVEGLIEGVTDLIGYKIDAYAVVDLTAFELMVDTIGGVNYDVPIDMYYDAPDQSFHVAIPKGYQWLSGEDALKVVRFRIGNNGSGYPDGDIGRIRTQQSFLKSVMSQMLQLGNIPNLTKLIDIYQENVETNLSAANLAFFAEEFLKIGSENMNFMTLPGNYNGSVKGGSYVLIDIPAWLEMINEHINPYYDTITESNVNLLTRDESGNFYSTTGTVAGGVDSFLDYDAYIASLGQ